MEFLSSYVSNVQHIKISSVEPFLVIAVNDLLSRHNTNRLEHFCGIFFLEEAMVSQKLIFFCPVRSRLFWYMLLSRMYMFCLCNHVFELNFSVENLLLFYSSVFLFLNSVFKYNQKYLELMWKFTLEVSNSTRLKLVSLIKLLTQTILWSISRLNL